MMWLVKGIIGAVVGLFFGTLGSGAYVNRNQSSKGMDRDIIPFTIIAVGGIGGAVLGGTRSRKRSRRM